MSTLIRPEISKNNEYWIPRHRYYELKHFCLQYREWVKIVNSLDSKLPSTSCIECIGGASGYTNSSHQADYCIKLVEKMKFKSEEPTPSVPINVLDVRQGDLMKRKRRLNNEIFRSS